MEAQFGEKLRIYSKLRSLVVDHMYRTLLKYAALPLRQLLQHNPTFHTLALLSSVSIVISVFAEERRLSLFSLHPVFMSAGCLVFLAEGIVAYRNNALLEVLSPIMQHNKKAKVRAIHQTLQIAGSIFLFLGLLFIFLHKFKAGKSIVPSTVHSVAGMVVIMLACIQGITGLQKVHQMDVNNKRVRRWHGASGLLSWDLVCFACCSGVVSFIPFGAVAIILCFSITFLWLSVHAQVDSGALSRNMSLRSESPSADSDAAQDVEAELGQWDDQTSTAVANDFSPDPIIRESRKQIISAADQNGGTIS